MAEGLLSFDHEVHAPRGPPSATSGGRGQKRALRSRRDLGCFATDFILFKRATDVIKLKEHLTTEGLKKLVSIKASIN